MSSDSVQKTITVAASLCIVCSIIVSSAAVFLKPVQEKNKALELKKNILAAAGLLKEGSSIEEQFKRITPKVINLATGEFVDTMDPVKYDQKKAAKAPETSIKIAPEKDIAKIRQRAKFATVYLVKKDRGIDTIILPIHGKGLWSTMYAFLALAGDTTTVRGLSFYDQLETPGLGGEVDNPLWKAKWPGKKVYDDQWKVSINLLKGSVDTSRPEAIHQVDGLAGATLTTRGVSNLVKYWVGDDGFGTFLAKLRNQGGAR